MIILYATLGYLTLGGVIAFLVKRYIYTWASDISTFRSAWMHRCSAG